MFSTEADLKRWEQKKQEGRKRRRLFLPFFALLAFSRLPACATFTGAGGGLRKSWRRGFFF
jgi:hypothetical protein